MSEWIDGLLKRRRCLWRLLIVDSDEEYMCEYYLQYKFSSWNRFDLHVYSYSHNACTCIACASFSAHNRVPIQKPTLRKSFCKYIRVRAAPQPCYKGGNSLREYRDVRRTHRSMPGGPFHRCSDCSATPRFRITFDGATSAQRHEHGAVPTWDAPLPRRNFRWIQNMI
jgi:hypothetical protein